MSHDITGLTGIIPHMPSIPHIYNNSYKEFKNCKNTSSHCGLDQSGSFSIFSYIIVKGQQTRATSQYHRPMCISSKQIFNYRVAYCSRKKYYNTHANIICTNQYYSRVIFLKFFRYLSSITSTTSIASSDSGISFLSIFLSLLDSAFSKA